MTSKNQQECLVVMYTVLGIRPTIHITAGSHAACRAWIVVINQADGGKNCNVWLFVQNGRISAATRASKCASNCLGHSGHSGWVIT